MAKWATLGIVVVAAAIGLVLWTQTDSQAAAQRRQYLLSQEPSGAVSILDARESLETNREIVLVGRIGGVASTWSTGKAAFVISDPSALAAQSAVIEEEEHAHDHESAADGHSHEHDGDAHDHAGHDHADHAHDHGHAGHDHANCPYCAAASKPMPKEALALVQLVDASGEVATFDVQRVLNLQEGQTVVVRGRAKLNEGVGTMTVTADGLYVRQ